VAHELNNTLVPILALSKLASGRTATIASSQILPSGFAVCLPVADTGCGIDEATVGRIFTT
jgi:hypothetical protein